MAVPKKKTSKSKRDMRRSHDALRKINVVIDRHTGEYRLPHHIDPSNGAYNERQIIVTKNEKNNQS